MSEGVTRRSALTAAAVVAGGAIVGFVVARNSDATDHRGASTAANAYGDTPGSVGQPLATLAEVPKGGGLILKTPAIVLTRGTDDEVRAFSAICTHQGCRVDRVADQTIDCPCHTSRFDAATGAVVSGPAPAPLPRVAVTVRDWSVYFA